MRLAAADQWRPQPGTLIDWTPTASTLAAAAQAPPHPTGPSFLQRDHILGVLAARAAGNTHRGYTCAAVTVDEDLDVTRMSRALTDFIRAHDNLRSRFRVEGTSIHRYLVSAEAIELAPTPGPPNTAPLDHLHHRLPHTAVFDAFPAVTFGAVTRPGSFDLYYAMDHAFGDGSAQILGLTEIIARYRGTIDELLNGTEPAGHLAYVDAEYARAAAMTTDDHAVGVWRNALTATGGVQPFPLPLGVDDGPAPVHIHSGNIADSAATDRLAQLARATGAGFTAALHAALAATDKRLAGRDTYCTATVLSTRGTGEYRWSQGWFCNFAPIKFAVDGHRITDLLPAAAEAVEAARQITHDPVHGALGVLMASGDLDPSAMAGSPQMVNYLDLRWFPPPADTRDLIVFTGEGRTRNASMWITRDHDGLHLALQRPDNRIAAQSVSRYIAALRETIATDTITADTPVTAAAPASEAV
ncbi:MAG: condensation domain-containing protein [Gordonia sp. (in: high G+C Gram-positive bacteria)]